MRKEGNGLKFYVQQPTVLVFTLLQLLRANTKCELILVIQLKVFQ